MQPGRAIRLNKFLAEQLGISRRQADDLIATGKILIENSSSSPSSDSNSDSDSNCTPATLGTRIDENTKIWFNNKLLSTKVQYIYLAINKPVGYVCSKKQQGDTPTIYELLPPKYQNLKTVGRLDKDSSGLILLTNDGDFAFTMTHPKFHKEKQYEVTLDRALEPLHQQMIADYGVNLPDGKSKLGLTHTDNARKKWIITMNEGRNRQIRRTFAAVGYKVVKLHRTQFGKYQLANLPNGKFQEIKKF